MRIIRHSLNNRIRGAMLIVLSVLLIGLIPLQAVFAATEEVSIPYRQTWSNKSGENVNNSFEYRLTAVDGAPLPEEASGGYYSFVMTGNASGTLNLHFPFSSPGYYHYHVSAYIPDRKAYYSYDEKTYDLMIMVINTESGLGIGAMTIQDNSLAKYAELPFSMAYTKAPPGNAGDGGAGAGGVAGAPGIVPTDADTTVIDDTVPPETIPDEGTPRSILPEPDYWALLNLILLVLTIVVAVTDGVLYFRKPTDKYGDEYEYEDDEDEEVKRHGLPRILAFITAIASFILFILTEDITEPMIWVDEYTIWMLILFIATVLLSMLSKKEYEDEESEQGAT